MNLNLPDPKFRSLDPTAHFLDTVNAVFYSCNQPTNSNFIATKKDQETYFDWKFIRNQNTKD